MLNFKIQTLIFFLTVALSETTGFLDLDKILTLNNLYSTYVISLTSEFYFYFFG